MRLIKIKANFFATVRPDKSNETYRKTLESFAKVFSEFSMSMRFQWTFEELWKVFESFKFFSTAAARGGEFVRKWSWEAIKGLCDDLICFVLNESLKAINAFIKSKMAAYAVKYASKTHQKMQKTADLEQKQLSFCPSTTVLIDCVSISAEKFQNFLRKFCA